jgi:outer membrane protein, multidrug efflux system
MIRQDICCGKRAFVLVSCLISFFLEVKHRKNPSRNSDAHLQLHRTAVIQSMKIYLRLHLLWFLGATMTWALAACSPIGPDYQSPQPEVPSQWREKSGFVTSNSSQNMQAWWTLFSDPLLDSLMEQASASNQDLRKAATRIREARAQRVIAGATGSVGTTASSIRSRHSDNTSSSSGTQNLFQVGFDADWELDIFGGVQRAIEAADASLVATKEDLRDTLVTLEAEVARNYLELRGCQKRLATAQDNITTQEKTVQLVLGRLQLGLSSELDLVQAKTQLSLTKSQVPSLQSSIRQAMYQLALLIGQPAESLIAELSQEMDIPLIPPRIPINLPSDLLRQRPDIRSAERQLAAATAEIGVATADLFPHFSLAALFGVQSINLSDLITSGSRYWSIGPSLNMSLFDQGKSRAAIEIRNARRDAALAIYEKSVLKALTEVESALVAFSQEQETRRILGEAVTSAQKAVSIANGLYELGLTDFLSVLQSEHALNQSQDQLVQSNQQLALDIVAIFKALGGGWHQEVPIEATPAYRVDNSPVIQKNP